MANNGRHSNTSQFFITLKRAPQLDGKHQVIGQLVEGATVLRAMQLVPLHHKAQTPKVEIRITGLLANRYHKTLQCPADNFHLRDFPNREFIYF